ncbi:hypothetical protein [Yoonia sediminilitoris]|nr:hypothetical protein [Yoonia sediminilitoris]
MTALSKCEAYLGTDMFMDRITVACRQIGLMVAEIENSVIDANQVVDRSEIPRQTLQKIDLVIQSIEELACIFERARSGEVSFREVDLDAVISPGRLEWLRTLVSEGVIVDSIARGNDDISLF